MKAVNVLRTLILIPLFLSEPALAQEQKADVYNSILDIPVYLRVNLNQGMYIEQYINQSLKPFRQNTANKSSISAQDIQHIKNQNEQEQKRQQVQRIITHDINFDGEVTRDEVLSSLEKRTRRNSIEQKQMIDSIMEYDINKNGVISIQEMGQLKPSDPEKISYIGRNDLDTILALDADGNGSVTAQEIESQARKAFRTLDKNNDDMLSAEELTTIIEINRSGMKNANFVDKCSLPSIPADAKFVIVNLYEGKTTSTVSLAGPSEETNVIPFDIKTTDENLYIVASSYSPVIWQFTGDTSKIKNLVLAGRPVKQMDNKIGAGAVGISADKITFRNISHCGLNRSFSEADANSERLLKLMQDLTGRMPNYYYNQYDTVGLQLFDGRLNAGNSEALKQKQTKAPKGVDNAVWQEHLRFMPGGIIDLKNQNIVSDVKAEPYKILPKWAGLAQLVSEGSIIPLYAEENTRITISNDDNQHVTLDNVESVIMGSSGSRLEIGTSINGFKIVKNIPYYPSGLHGAHSTKFLIAKGVTPPEGDPGHSDVVSEETGEHIAGPGMRLLDHQRLRELSTPRE